MTDRFPAPPGLLEIGVVRRPHGVKGDTYVDLLTDREERLAVGSRLWAGSQWRTITFSKHLPQRWLVHFEGFDDRTAVEALTNAPLFAEPVEDLDALWAHDLLELQSGALVPVVFVVSCVDGITTIDPPDGLFDLDA